jgi:hypothetical protein
MEAWEFQAQPDQREIRVYKVQPVQPELMD